MRLFGKRKTTVHAAYGLDKLERPIPTCPPHDFGRWALSAARFYQRRHCKRCGWTEEVRL